MGNPLHSDGETPYVSGSLINKIYGVYSNALHFAMPNSSLRTNEADLVRGVLQILQGFSSSLFYWDHDGQRYCATSEVYVSHLSRRGLHAILNQFLYAASCLQLVNIVVSKVEASARLFSPTLRAFSCSVSEWLKRLRDIALSEEVKISSSDLRTTPTLLGLASSLSSLCAGAEYLLQVVDGAIPEEYFDPGYVFPAAQVAAHILDHLHQKLSEACLAQDGQEEAYRMLLYIFVGSLLPYIEVLDAWLYEGTLDDPFEEMFFHANKEILVDEAEFWERSYVLRPTQFPKLNPEVSTITPHIDSITNGKNSACGKEFTSTSASVKEREWKARNDYVCPSFIKGIAKSIVSAGKSLQLMQYVPGKVLVGSGKENGIERVKGSGYASGSSKMQHENNIAGLTLSEVFCVSLAGLTGDGDHIFNYFWQDDPSNFKNLSLLKSLVKNQEAAVGNDGSLLKFSCSNKIWYKLLLDTLSRKEITALQSEDIGRLPDSKGSSVTPANSLPLSESLCPINPVITVCRSLLSQNMDTWNTLNISRNFNLPPLNDEDLRASIFGGKNTTSRETNFRFQFADFSRSETDIRALEEVFPFPTLLPSIQEDQHISEILPFQKNSTLPSRVLSWIQTFEPKGTPLPVVIVQECLTFYIRKQVDYIGRHMLVKLMTGWRLMDELGVLRAIYLLGSGDLLQHFLTVIFDKLDKGESWDDDFELNTILQESIRNSADGMLLSASDSLVVSLSKSDGLNDEQQSLPSSTPQRGFDRNYGINGLDFLRFTYKVSWPLELIANTEAMKKYNQVMHFLLKVKRAKYVLDKARRWIWKGRGTAAVKRKRHWLLEQKLLHFVDAFHQYVMDRVYHSAWRELCEGMAAARSLDEVIEVHEGYLLTIQRQCFVVPDKLWVLIASRINSILGLALDFYSIEQTLSSGGAVSAMKARCEMEVDRIEKQFDSCIAFLLRILSLKLNVGHFPHLADLVTRINYNYFYMSDSGSLVTVPGSDTVSSKPVKPFSIRTD